MSRGSQNLMGRPPFDSRDEPAVTDSQISLALDQIKRDARDRRIAMVAPLALTAALIGAFLAAPPRYGGLAVADADDQTEWPRVFGANGVWQLAEPIGSQYGSSNPADFISVPDEPAAPTYALVSPAPRSLSASASPPPAPTLGQPVSGTDDQPQAEATDWSAHRLDVRIVAVPTTSTPEASAPAEAALAPDGSSISDISDEDVAEAENSLSAPTGDADLVSDADTGERTEGYPSTPQFFPSDRETRPSSAVATIVPRSVLVHSAHVSVTVQVVDDDSSVIDWCNTRVDWGDGSVTGLSDPDGSAECAARCEHLADPLGDGMVEPAGLAARGDGGLTAELVFTHEYDRTLDVAPRVFVATGDGCSYTLAEHQLPEFTVAPY